MLQFLRCILPIEVWYEERIVLIHALFALDFGEIIKQQQSFLACTYPENRFRVVVLTFADLRLKSLANVVG